jgi:type II secretory pathway pseudopilin PulG
MTLTLELISTLLSILSVIVIPVLMMFYRKLNKIEQLYNDLKNSIKDLYELSNTNDSELLTH